MRGLSHASPLDRGDAKSLLQPHTANDLRVTASVPWFMSHLRHTAARAPRGADWGFKVVTDADLMVAWLATAALQGADIIDADVRSEAAPVSLNKLTLVDIAAPPELLIIRLGVKVARNSAMPEVLYEALTIRAHEGKPTWVWDQPDVPFDDAHLSYSRLVAEFMESWQRVHQNDEPIVQQKQTRSNVVAPQPKSGNKPTSIRDIMFLGKNK